MKETLEMPPEISEPRRRARLAVFLTRLVREQPLGLIGGMIVLLFLFTGIFADWLAPYGVNDIHPRDYLHPPHSSISSGRTTWGGTFSAALSLGPATR